MGIDHQLAIDTDLMHDLLTRRPHAAVRFDFRHRGPHDQDDVITDLLAGESLDVL